MIPSVFAQAVSTHQAGRHGEAEAMYRRLLDKFPDDARVLTMLGTLVCEQGDLADGISLLEKAVRLAPREVVAQFNLAIALTRNGRIADAVKCYEQILRRSPVDADACARLAELLDRNGEPARAAVYYERAVRSRPDNARWHSQLGVVRGKLGQYTEAIAASAQAIRLAPEDAESHFCLGLALQEVGKYEEAIQAYARSAELLPVTDRASCLNNIGNLLRLMGRLDEALPVLEQALAVYGDHPDANINMASTLLDLGRPAEALPHYERALAALPRSADCHANYGMALEVVGRHQDAVNAYSSALQADPLHPEALFGLALHALARADFESGWAGYEHRWRCRHLLAGERRAFSQPSWNGEPLQERRLLVYSEQGLGDEIMFASIFPELIQEAKQCTIECTPRLHALFLRSFPQARVVATDRSSPGWLTDSVGALQREESPDFQVPAGSLGSIRRRRLADFPPHGGYLVADRERTAHWKTRLDALGPGLKIGLSWRGGTHRTGIVRRSLSLLQLLPVLEAPHVQFVSLQYTQCADEIAELARRGVKIHHWQEAIDDYDETAALLGALDLTISVCTSVIHLSGAMGKPVWIMAPTYPEWRYGTAGDAMPWYPSARIFRANGSGDWDSVIERIAAELSRQRTVRLAG